jgi:subtilisin family serine protease
MRRMTALLAAAGALLLLYASGVLAQPETPTQNIPDRYIVVFEDGVQRPAALANEHARASGLQVRFVYTSAIEGYAAVFPNDRALQRVQSDPRVDYVEQDQVVRATAQTLPWGIDRIEADVSSTHAGDGGLLYPENNTISNVNVYIIDTGVDASHADLNVVNHVNPSGAGGGNTDCNGHGTHVAGTVAARDNTQDVVGVAPEAPITGVKVLGCGGTGTTTGVIAGVDWVTANANVKGDDGTLGTEDDDPAIANMSLGGGASLAEDTAVRNSAASGVFYSIAAGNNDANACNYSPARAGRTKNADGTWNKDNGIMTVAATNSSEEEASWSNHGPCVDIWAPGVNVRSTKLGGGTVLKSGTSMAAPHVGGGGALYLSSAESASPVEVEVTTKAAAVSTGTENDNDQKITRLYVGGF